MMDDRPIRQESLFYQFRLNDHVPADHMLRAIDRFLDLNGLRRHLVAFCSTTGRPAIDPELMIRMLLVGYCFGSTRSGGYVKRCIDVSFAASALFGLRSDAASRRWEFFVSVPRDILPDLNAQSILGSELINSCCPTIR